MILKIEDFRRCCVKKFVYKDTVFYSVSNWDEDKDLVDNFKSRHNIHIKDIKEATGLNVTEKDLDNSFSGISGLTCTYLGHCLVPIDVFDRNQKIEV